MSVISINGQYFNSYRDYWEYQIFKKFRDSVPLGIHFTHDEAEELISLIRAGEMVDRDYTRWPKS